jgi:hypothetical protein
LQAINFNWPIYAIIISDPQLKGVPLHQNATDHMRPAEKIYKKLTSTGYVGQEH